MRSIICIPLLCILTVACKEAGPKQSAELSGDKNQNTDESLPENSKERNTKEASFREFLLGKEITVENQVTLAADESYSPDLAGNIGAKATGWWVVNLKRIETAEARADITLNAGEVYQVIGVSQYYRNFAMRMSNIAGMLITGFLVGQTSLYRDVFLSRQGSSSASMLPFTLRVLTDHATGSIYMNEGKYIRDVIDGTSVFQVKQ
jgi:hypothetical protein